MNRLANLLIEHGVKFTYECSFGIEQIEAPDFEIEVSTQGDDLYYNYRTMYHAHKKSNWAFNTVIDQIEVIIIDNEN